MPGDEREVRPPAVVTDVGLGHRVELEGRHPRAYLGREELEGAGDEQPGGAHASELLGGLALAAVAVEQTHAAPAQGVRAVRMRFVTRSTSPSPSTSTSRPRSR